MTKILTIILLSGICLFAQQFNTVEVDSQSGKPMLIGRCTLEAFSDTSFSWWWNSNYNLYQVDLNTVDRFAEDLFDVDITIILGTWCGDSKREIPHLIKILEEAGYPVEDIAMLAVNREKFCNDVDVNQFGVELVPTIIFFKDGKEIGRIIESPEESLETDILKILHG